MKDQYFGDINDYRKYGILRCLAEVGRFSAGVCWMLTASDRGTHGSFTHYLNSPAKWRHFDPPLFDALHHAVVAGERRAVSLAEEYRLLHGAIYFATEIPAGQIARTGYIAACLECVVGSDLVFFDPDNGIEVPSVSYGAKAAHKYVYWRELATAFDEGHSLLVYQHYPRQERPTFHRKIGHEFKERLHPVALWGLATSTVVYLLAVQASHVQRAEASVQAIQERWGQQIRSIALLDA